MKEFIEKIANSGLYPTSVEWWKLVNEAKIIIINDNNQTFY